MSFCATLPKGLWDVPTVPYKAPPMPSSNHFAWVARSPAFEPRPGLKPARQWAFIFESCSRSGRHVVAVSPEGERLPVGRAVPVMGSRWRNHRMAGELDTGTPAAPGYRASHGGPVVSTVGPFQSANTLLADVTAAGEARIRAAAARFAA